MSAEDINPGKVWSRFCGKQKDGTIVHLRIQDLKWNEHKQDIIDYLMKYFINEEALHKAAGVSNNEDAVAEYKEICHLLYNTTEPHVSVCYKDDEKQNKDILGISIMVLKKPQQGEDDLKDLNPKAKELHDFFKIIKVIKDIKASNDSESIYEGRGISVRPDYRGLGIANEFVRLRKQVCIDHDIQTTCAWMTSLGTQKAADKYNWKTFHEIPVEEFSRRTGLPFDVNVPSFKLMYTTKD